MKGQMRAGLHRFLAAFARPADNDRLIAAYDKQLAEARREIETLKGDLSRLPYTPGGFVAAQLAAAREELAEALEANAKLRDQLGEVTAQRDRARRHRTVQAAQTVSAKADATLNRIGTVLRPRGGNVDPYAPVVETQTVICGQPRENCLRDQETMRRLLAERDRR